jgi:hypothetical protein
LKRKYNNTIENPIKNIPILIESVNDEIAKSSTKKVLKPKHKKYYVKDSEGYYIM